MPPTCGCSISGGSRIIRIRGAHGVFWVHFSQLRRLLNEFGENRGGDLCLEVGLADLLYVPAGGGGGANAHSAYGPGKIGMLEDFFTIGINPRWPPFIGY